MYVILTSNLHILPKNNLLSSLDMQINVSKGKGPSVTDTRPIDRIPGIPGSDKNIRDGRQEHNRLTALWL